MKRSKRRTKRITISNFSPPAAYEVNLVLWNSCHSWVPASNQLHIFIHFIRLDFVEYDGVDIFPSRQHLREAPLNILVELPSLRSAIYQRRQCAALLPPAILRFSCAC